MDLPTLRTISFAQEWTRLYGQRLSYSIIVAGLWLGTENGTNRQREQLDENIIPPLNWMNKSTYIKTNTENWNEIHNIISHSFSLFIFSTCNNTTIIFAFTTVNCIYATYSTKTTMYEKYTIDRTHKTKPIPKRKTRFCSVSVFI